MTLPSELKQQFDEELEHYAAEVQMPLISGTEVPSYINWSRRQAETLGH